MADVRARFLMRALGRPERASSCARVSSFLGARLIERVNREDTFRSGIREETPDAGSLVQ